MEDDDSSPGVETRKVTVADLPSVETVGCHVWLKVREYNVVDNSESKVDVWLESAACVEVSGSISENEGELEDRLAGAGSDVMKDADKNVPEADSELEPGSSALVDESFPEDDQCFSEKKLLDELRETRSVELIDTSVPLGLMQLSQVDEAMFEVEVEVEVCLVGSDEVTETLSLETEETKESLLVLCGVEYTSLVTSEEPSRSDPTELTRDE